MSSLSTNTYTNLSTSNTLSNAKDFTPVRVVDIILDDTHPEYDKYGRTRCVGGIKYVPVDVDINSDDPSTLPLAVPINSTFKTYPLVNEIVLITFAPDQTLTKQKAKSTSVQAYYTTVVSIWNHPHHNSTPDNINPIAGLGKDFKEQTDINPLQPFPGDVLIEGRLGQSIRMSGANHFENIYTNQSNEGSPFTILSNGQKSVGNGSKYIVEDINKDPSSIYLMSNQTVPLEQARNKTKTWKNPPVKANSYQGSQVIVNGGRLYFNSRDESILFSAKEAFGVTSKTINLDGKDYIALDANKIYLGEKALVEEYEPVLLGETTEQFLSELLYNLQELAKDLIKAKTIDGKIIPNLIVRGKLLDAGIKGLKEQINPGGISQLKSKKVYTE